MGMCYTLCMANIYGKGNKGKATKLHAEIVRSLGYCERCGSPDQLQCAHIVSRGYSATRTDIENAMNLCAGCHMYFTKWPVEFALFVFYHKGIEGYNALKKKALDGVGKRLDWAAEVERLSLIKQEMIDNEKV